MNREINPPITRRGSLLWRFHSMQRKSRRRGQALGKWVCQRSPDLCLSLERARKAMFRYDPEVTEVQVAALALCVATRLGFRALGGVGYSFDRRATYEPAAVLGVGAALWYRGNRASCGAESRDVWDGVPPVAMLGFLMWSFVSVLMLLDGLTSLGTVLFPVVALCEAWVYLRLTTCSFELDSSSTNGTTGEMSGPGGVSEMDNASEW